MIEKLAFTTEVLKIAMQKTFSVSIEKENPFLMKIYIFPRDFSNSKFSFPFPASN